MPGNTKVAIECTDADGLIIITAVEDGCDPKQTVLRGMELPEALEHVYPFIEESRVEWADAPKYQTYQKPKQPRKAKETPLAQSAAPGAAPPPGATTTAELPLLASQQEPAQTEAAPAPSDLPQDQEPMVSGPTLGLGFADPAERVEDTEHQENGEVTVMTQEHTEGYEEEQQAVATHPEDEDDGNGSGDGPENGGSDGDDQQPVAQEAAPTKASRGAKYLYKVVIDGQEQQFEHTHDALRALGVSQDEIDKHKYWHRHDRLPKEHKERIQQVPA